MSATTTLIVALAAYIAAAAWVHRSSLSASRHSAERHGHHAAPGFLVRLIACLALIVIGGVMVLAGSALVFDTGSLGKPLPLSERDVFQVLKDVVPGIVSIVVGFLLLESSNHMTPGGEGHVWG